MRKPFTPAQIEAKKVAIVDEFKKHALTISPRQVDFFVRRKMGVGFIGDRLRQMVDAGVPLSGFAYKMRMSKRVFDEMLLRFKSPNKFSSSQESVFRFLMNSGVSFDVATRLLKGRRFPTRLNLSEKIAFFESLDVEPMLCGVNRIPVRYYERFLGRELREIKKAYKRNILWVLENDYARKQLSIALLGWTKSKELMKLTPRIVYRRYLAASYAGLDITIKLLSEHSAKALLAMTPKKNKTNPGIRKLEVNVDHLGEKYIVVTKTGISQARQQIDMINVELTQLAGEYAFGPVSSKLNGYRDKVRLLEGDRAKLLDYLAGRLPISQRKALIEHL